MLNRFEFLFPILTSWIIAGIVYFLVQKRNTNKLPPGSIVVDEKATKLAEFAPGTWMSRFGVNSGHMINDFTLFFLIILSIFDLWSIIPQFLIIPLPIWLNWIGLFGLIFQYIWQISILVYNINFLPNSKRITPGYILATGGPYRLVRHPTYVNYIAVTIFLFLTTGLWWVLVSAIGWIAFPYQARAEEDLLQQKFGEKYTNYAIRTGRFFPKF